MNQIETIAREVVDSAFVVHKELGPGLLESAYQFCLEHELQSRSIKIERQWPVPLIFRGEKLDCGYRIDLMVERKIILEIKAVDAFHPIHTAQILTYLRLTNLSLGFLLNFNTQYFKTGIRRIALNHTY